MLSVRCIEFCKYLSDKWPGDYILPEQMHCQLRNASGSQIGIRGISQRDGSEFQNKNNTTPHRLADYLLATSKLGAYRILKGYSSKEIFLAVKFKER